MRDFNVLFTCCGAHVKERIDTLRLNEDGANVKVFAVNCNKLNLPPSDMTDGAQVVPKISEDTYLSTIMRFCREKKIDIIVPTVTLELEFMAANKRYFEDKGIKVSIASPEALSIANNKIRLYEKYGILMPKQCIPLDIKDVEQFKSRIPKSTLCYKLSNHCGGNGFAIVDDEKSLDMNMFNKLGENHYISYDQLRMLLEKKENDIIVQEFTKGYDYSVSVLAVNGRVTHICGYIGYQMSFGAIINGEIMYNRKAYMIAEKICRELGIDGNACFDFRLKENGEVVLLEINPRINASLPFVREAGCNMLYLRCKNLLGDFSDTEKSTSINYGLRMKKFYNSKYY